MLAVIGLIAAILVTAATPSGAVLEAGIGSDSALSSARTAYSNVGEWLDTSDRQAVLDSYQAEFSKPDPDIGWTGNRASCQAGTTNPAYRSAIIDRVNWFRSIAGVPANITENATYSAKAQQAALMMSVSDRLSHSPDSSFDCYTAIGSEAAGKSNLYLGRTGPHAITGYMFDPGSGNVSVGHRNWILHPSVRQFGTGDTPGPGRQATNTLWVIDNAFASQPVMRESDGFVAWPARGYVPGDLVFPRWSFSLRGADLDQASVAVQRTENGQVVENIVSPVVFGNDSRGAPFSIVVWEPVGIDTSPAVDETYRVTIGNVGVGSATRSFSYEVTIIGDRAASQRPLASSAEIAAFANAAFNDFVGRDATQAEKDLWVARILGGSSRNSLVADLAQSDEWAANVVDKMYQDTLGRNADPRAEHSGWISSSTGPRWPEWLPCSTAARNTSRLKAIGSIAGSPISTVNSSIVSRMAAVATSGSARLAELLPGRWPCVSISPMRAVGPESRPCTCVCSAGRPIAAAKTTGWPSWPMAMT